MVSRSKPHAVRRGVVAFLIAVATVWALSRASTTPKRSPPERPDEGFVGLTKLLPSSPELTAVVAIETKFGVHVVTVRRPRRIGPCTVAPALPNGRLDTLDPVLEGLSRALPHYGQDCLHRMSLAEIVLSARLECDPVDAGESESIGPVAYQGEDKVILQTDLEDPSWVVHHELFHQLDQSVGTHPISWPETLPGESYSSVGPCAALTKGQRSNVAEDRAETFANLVERSAATRACAAESPLVNAHILDVEDFVAGACPSFVF